MERSIRHGFQELTSSFDQMGSTLKKMVTHLFEKLSLDQRSKILSDLLNEGRLINLSYFFSTKGKFN